MEPFGVVPGAYFGVPLPVDLLESMESRGHDPSVVPPDEAWEWQVAEARTSQRPWVGLLLPVDLLESMEKRGHDPSVVPPAEAWEWEAAPVDPDAEALEEYRRCSPAALLPAAIGFAQQANREQRTISVPEGGNVFTFKHPDPGSGRIGGGDRGAVVGFSRQSRTRLMRLVNSFNRDLVDPVRLWFVTLTYPASWPSDPRKWKRDLDTFHKRLERSWGRLPVIWKMEPQKRGAPHFHLLVMVPKEWISGMECLGKVRRRGRRVYRWRGGKLSEFRHWCSQSWFEVVQSGDEWHWQAGTNVEPVHSWNGVCSYTSKYLGKECHWIDQETGQLLNVGRFWGVWRKDLFPIKWLRCHFDSEATWFKVKRNLRRYTQATDKLDKGRRNSSWWVDNWFKPSRGLSAFIPADVVLRILELEYLTPGGISCWDFARGRRRCDIWFAALDMGIEAPPPWSVPPRHRNPFERA